MGKIVKPLQGYSGSKIYLMQSGNTYFVRKIGNVERNYERLSVLQTLGLSVVNILSYENDILDLEYIQGADMKTYLLNRHPKELANFISESIDSIKKTERNVKDYTEVYNYKLNWIDKLNLPFDSKELISKLPKFLNQSQYFGDLTLENILFNKQKGFIIIDPATIEYDSWYFDLAKLNQDLTCKWFLRNSRINLDHKLSLLKRYIEEHCGEINTYLTIAMLLRVYKHALKDNTTKDFLNRHINLLWK
jgi:RIO-like serine/threonine protein kinase